MGIGIGIIQADNIRIGSQLAYTAFTPVFLLTAFSPLIKLKTFQTQRN